MHLGLFIKHFFSFFVEPLGFVMTLFAVGIFFLLKEKVKMAKIFLSVGLFFLFLFSYPSFADFLVKGLENSYQKYSASQKIKYIHVLGSGHNTDPLQPLSSHLDAAATKRVLEGVLLYKKIPHSKLIFTGYAGKTDVSTAQMNANLALALGVKKEDIIINGRPEDTRDEAAFCKTIVGDKPFILVTSATHMHRAMKLFQMQGLHPLPAPTNFYRDNQDSLFQSPVPEALLKSKIAMHEYIGILWSKIR